MNASEACLTRPTTDTRRPIAARLLATTGNLYCRIFHRAISRPVRGKYHCWKCLRQFDLEW